MIGSIEIIKSPYLSAAPEISVCLYRGSGWRENSYSHEIRAHGGYWGASFDMIGPPELLRDVFEDGLMQYVRAYEERGDLAFEGFVASLTLRTGGEEHRISVDNISNNVQTIYESPSDVGASATVKEYNPDDISQAITKSGVTSISYSIGTLYTDLDSLGRFGYFYKILDAGEASATVANQISQIYLDRFAQPYFPSRNIDFGRSVGEVSLRVEVRGYIRLLDYYYYYNSDPGTSETTPEVATRIYNNQATYFAKSADIQTNATQVEAHNTSRRRSFDVLESMASLGDPSLNHWVFGMEDDLRFYFREEATADAGRLKYFGMNTDRGLQILADGSTPIPASLVRPDNYYKSGSAYPWRALTPQDADEDYNASYIEAVRFSEPNRLELSTVKDESIDILLARAGRGGFNKL